jgi:hypothetical protein
MKKQLVVTMYASWLKDDQNNRKDFLTDEGTKRSDLFKEEWKNHTLTNLNNFNGFNGDKKVILCTSKPFLYISDPTEGEGEVSDYKIVIVKFNKSIDKIFLDEDDNSLPSKFENITKKYKGEKIPISIFESHLDINELLKYGCYVDEIQENEIVSIKEQYQEE